MAAGICWCAALSVSGWLRLACLLLCSGLLGAAALEQKFADAEEARPDAGIEVAIAARTCGIHRYRAYSEIDLCGARDLSGRRPLPERIRLALPAVASGRLGELRASGEWMRARLRLRGPRGRRNPGGRDRRRELAREGVGALARLVHPDWWVAVEEGEGTELAPLSTARSRARAGLLRAGPGAGLVAALALGDRSMLSTETSSAFRALGLSHLLAVSGLHVVLVAGLCFAVARKGLSVSRRLAERGDVSRVALGASLLVALAYGALTGFAVPVSRALIFLGVVAICEGLGRRSGRASALALAALVLLLWNPAWLFSLGAQLSFLATAGLLSARPVDAWSGVAGWLQRSLATTAAALLSTLPLLASAGVTTGSIGLVANLVAVPWVAFVLLPGSLVAAALCAGGDASVYPTAGSPLASGSSLVVEGVLTLAHWSEIACVEAAALIDGAGASPTNPPGRRAPLLWLGLCGVLGFAALRLGSIGRIAMVFALSWLLSLDFAGVPADPRAVVFDVGQGDAILLQSPQAAVLVDAGWASPEGANLGRSTVVPALGALGVRALDVAIVTHADLDHRGGMAAVLRALPVGELWLPLRASQEPEFDALRQIAADRGTPVREVGANEPIRLLPGLALEVLWPVPGLDAPGWTRNERSIVLGVGIAGRRILLTGDIGAPAERALLAAPDRLRAEIVKLGHHGSASASSAEFLGAVGAEVALLSAACCDARLPSPAALARAHDANASLWWTGRDGALVVELGPPIAVWGFEQAPPRH